MKPRIYILRGLWRCRCVDDGWLHLGLGYTPKEAYRDWADRVLSKWKTA